MDRDPRPIGEDGATWTTDKPNAFTKTTKRMTVKDEPDRRVGRSGLLRAIAIDLRRLHHRWMALGFPEHRQETHPVLGDWYPSSPLRRIVYRLWTVPGWGIVILLYPFLLAGFITRFYVRRMDRFARRVGLLGLVVTSVLLWSALTTAAYLRDFPVNGLLALLAAGGVATVSGVLSRLCTAWDGRPVSVLLAYPFGVTAVFLPPVVAALYSEALAAVVFARSDVLAIWLLDAVLATVGLDVVLRSTFDLVGIAYVGMWFGIAVPVGWVLGLTVTLAEVVRPTSSAGDRASSDPADTG